MPEQIETKEVLLTFSNGETVTITAELRRKFNRGGFAMFSDTEDFIHAGEEISQTEVEALSEWLEKFIGKPVFISDDKVYCTNQIVKATVKEETSVRRPSGFSVSGGR